MHALPPACVESSPPVFVDSSCWSLGWCLVDASVLFLSGLQVACRSMLCATSNFMLS